MILPSSRKLTTAVRGAVIAVVLAVAVLFLSSGTANAKMIGQCNGAFWGMLSQSACVVVVTGAKDGANHREWIESVEVNHDAAPHFLEVWGDGFYFTGYGSTSVHPVRKWVRSGTHICGAVTDNYGVRSVACITISA